MAFSYTPNNEQTLSELRNAIPGSVQLALAQSVSSPHQHFTSIRPRFGAGCLWNVFHGEPLRSGETDEHCKSPGQRRIFSFHTLARNRVILAWRSASDQIRGHSADHRRNSENIFQIVFVNLSPDIMTR
ncbi:hypothetical protein C032_00471 [Brucella abortus 63/294]|nr:hypothetical protein C032_00471 [Brucella abortus 63/294]ERT96090.1 hypothetical protein P039_03386 [Brucella abortus 07-0994-2411]